MNINRLLSDVLGVVLNNEMDNSPEDITEYVDSETILDYFLNEDEQFLSNFLNYIKTSSINKYYPSYGDDIKPYFKVLHAMLISPNYRDKCEAFMDKYGFDIEEIKKDF